MKNEKPYLKEWLEYHRLQGVEHFYLCDNDSTDGTAEYLAPYIKRGLITYIKMTGINQQLSCYENTVNLSKKQTRWLALIDIDEYLLPLTADNMQDFLQEFRDVSEVSLHWLNYGDSGALSRPNGLITEFFTAHGRKINHTVKSIVKPEKVIGFNHFGANHYVKVNGASVNEYHKPVTFMLDFNLSADKARVNHYITKTFSEFLHKKSRGHPEGTPIQYEYFFFHNENDVNDNKEMARFLPALKKRMAASPLADVPLPIVENLPATKAEFFFSPAEVSAVLHRKIEEPMRFDNLEEAYKNRRPSYKKQDIK